MATTDKKKTQQEINKQAIANIMKTGTVDGSKSNVVDNNNVVTTNTDAFNLAGTDINKSAVGTPRVQNGDKKVSTATSSFSNALGTPSANQEKGKTFAPELPTFDVKPARIDLGFNTQEKTYQNRDSFKSDYDYENYLVGNNVDLSKGDAYNYIKDKAEIEGLNTAQYTDAMRTNYRNTQNVEKIQERYNNGELSQQQIDDINNSYGVLLDENGNELDADRYNNDIELFTKTAEDINKEIEKLNSDYKKGKIDYATLENEYTRLKGLWDENQAFGNSLNNVKELRGFDYYDWAKSNGRDVRDFERLVENVDDSQLERLVQAYNASWWDTLSIPAETLSMVRTLIDNDYDIRDAGNVSSQMKATAQELKEYVHFGQDWQNRDDANWWKDWSLTAIESLMPMINSWTISLITGVPSEPLANWSIGLSTAGDVMRMRLDEGNNKLTAFTNAAIHGTIAGIVEGMDAGRTFNIFKGSVGKYMSAFSLLGKPSVMRTLFPLLTSWHEEGTEEIVEDVGTYLADTVMNCVSDVLNALGYDGLQRVNVENLSLEDEANKYAMAFYGSAILGAPASIGETINTKRKYNAVMRAREHFETVINNPIASIAEKDLAKKSIENIDYALKTSPASASTLVNAVSLESDYVEPLVTYDELMNRLANVARPDIQKNVDTAAKTLEYSNQIKSTLQDTLLNRGINMPVDAFLSATDSGRNDYIAASKILNDSGISNSYTNLGRGRNGKYANGGVLLNTNQSESIDIDKFADLDDASFDSANIKDSDELYDKAGANASSVFAAFHEGSHFAENSRLWKNIRDTVREAMGDERFNRAARRMEAFYKTRENQDVDGEREVVAYYMQKNMFNKEFLSRMARYNGSVLNRIFSNLVNAVKGDEKTKLENLYLDAIRDAQNKAKLSGTPSYSIGTVFQALGMNIRKEGNSVVVSKDGNDISEVTLDDVKESHLGRLMDISVQKGFITQKEADDQMGMYRDVCNLIIRTNDPDLTWAISGSIGYQPATEADNDRMDETVPTKSSALTSNSDKQYKRTFDVTTICTKTQQVINVMSEVMKELGRGLTEDEVVKIVYDEVNKAGEPVPCPVCYVFSRWVGVGGLLDDINNFQKEYADADLKHLRNKLNELDKQVDEIAKKEGKRKSKARDILFEELNDEYTELLSKKNLESLAGKKMSKADADRISQLEEEIKILDRWAWIKDVRLNPNYEPVPPEILFDLNKGEQFANDYPLTWRYRTTRGPARGKAITPYTSEVLGQTIMGFAKSPSSKNMGMLGQMRGENNPFINDSFNDQMKAIDSAIKNAKKQNLVGGSRAQSTSDFRFEYVLDYLLHFMDLQAIGSYGQTYTKVPEAVAMLASVNYEVNMSLMPKGFGWEIVKKGTENAYQLPDGKWYRLVCSDKTGMSDVEAYKLAETYDNAQPIMVGINDEHIRLCMADPRITFIIPYHASGSTEGRYLSMMQSVGEEVPAEARRDYSDFQNDMPISNAKQSQIDLRKLRMDIITGKAKNFSRKQMATVREHFILGDLYDRFYVKGVDPECYGNFLNKDQASQIFPYEYWDKTSTIDTADINGDRFVQYCNDLGIVPRFQQFAGESGYWKMLIDRKMYNNDGTYHQQKAVNLDNFNTDFLYKKKMVEGLVQPENASKDFDNKKTTPIANKVLNRIDEQFSLGRQKNIDNLRQWGIDHNDQKSIDEADDLEERRIKSREMREDINNGNLYNYVTPEDFDRRVAEKRKEIEDDYWRDNQTDEWYRNEVIEDLIMERHGWRITDQGDEVNEFFADDDFDKLKNIVETTEGKKTKFRSSEYYANDPTFEDIFGENSRLLKMYPELKGIKFGVVNKPSSTGGATISVQYGKNGPVEPKVIYANKLDIDGNPRPIEKITESLGHEVQHLIQAIEKLPPGGDASKMPFRKYYNLPGEVQARSEGSKQSDSSRRLYKGDIITSNGKPIEDIDDTIGNNPETGELPEPSDIDTGKESIDEGNEETPDGIRQPDEEIPEEQDVSGTSGRDDAEVNPDEKVAKVLKEAPKPEGLKSLIKKALTRAGHYIVDRYAAIDEIGRATGNKNLTNLTDAVMRAPGRAYVAIYNGIYDKTGKNKIGKSLTEIMGKIPKDMRNLFDEYIYHYRNIDEMSMVERFGEEYKNRPVFGESVTADVSRNRVKEIEAQHPEFKAIAEDLWELNRNLLNLRKESGIISQETYDKFVEERPHYVRIMRIPEGGTGGSSINPNDIKKFKGSTKDILPLEDTMMQHILSTYRVIANNDLNSELLNVLGNKEDADADEIDTLVDEEYNPVDDKEKKIFAYNNGKKYGVEVNNEIYNALKPVKDYNDPLRKIGDMTISKVSKTRRALLTNLNPLFSLFTNPTKDIQDALRNTKYLKKYPKNLLRAVNDIAKNGEYSRQYDNLGIRTSQYVGKDLADAFKSIETNKGVKKWLNNLVSIGENIEKIPRLAEFISSLEAGNSPEQAAYDAAEVTTNFKRGGTLVKTMDRYGFTFLNASVQGFDKQVRNAKGDIEKIKKNGIKGIISVLAQLTLASGIPLRMLQDWLWRDDEEYQELSDYIKNGYYIIPNLVGMAKGEGGKFGNRFVRIPKGRIATFYQAVLGNVAKTLKGQVDVWDALLDDLQSFADNVAPNNPLDSNIFSPLYQVKSGKTWYGDDLIPSRLQDEMPSEQYDESTDAISIGLGELSRKIAQATGNDKFELSPYKINYLLDQYSGIIGDVALPALSLKTDVPINNKLAKGVATAVLDKFTTDPVLKNQNVTSLYDLSETLTKKSQSRFATDEQILSKKYLDTVKSAMNKLYAEKRIIQSDEGMSNKEKYARVRDLQKQINDLAREGLANYDQIDMTGDYASVGGVVFYKGEDGWTKPSKTQLEKINNAGLSNEDRTDYFKTIAGVNSVRETIKNNTPKDQKADYTQATIDTISNSNMSYKGKNTLFDSYYDSKATNHINSMDIDDEQKYNLKVAMKTAEGTKDANGKTISNSKAEATAEAYRKLGLLDDVLDYIKNNDINPSELGLSKSVYKSLTGGSSYTNAYSSSMKKSSSGGSKSSSVTSSKVKVGTSSGGAKLQAKAPLTQKSENRVVNNYLKAYSNTLKSAKPSTGGSSVTCPNCGNKVTPYNGRCPICGASL